jgi:hypothetical protein
MHGREQSRRENRGADLADGCAGTMLLDVSIEAALRAEAEQPFSSCEEKEVASLLLPGIL